MTEAVILFCLFDCLFFVLFVCFFFASFLLLLTLFLTLHCHQQNDSCIKMGTMPTITIDCFYITLFSALKQTHCAWRVFSACWFICASVRNRLDSEMIYGIFNACV